MQPTPLFKATLLLTVILSLSITGLAFGVLHKEDFSTQVRFSLVDQTGEIITNEDLRGQYLLVFFGFTNCANTCPIQMSKLTMALQQLDQNKLEKRITPVFITVDPVRDSAERLNEYLENFDERFIGLTGTTAALARASKSFKTLSANKASVLNDSYDIAHSSVIYVINPLGRMVDFIPFEADALAITERIKELVL